MPAISASAPGKVILFGEHAVVYGRPALAVPVTQVRARVVITPLIHAPAGRVDIDAPAVGLSTDLASLPEGHPLAAAVRGTLEALNIAAPPAMSVCITSTIPVAGGLGSGAAVSVALIRAVSAFCGRPLADETVCDLAYQMEKIHHGSPSGIDNTVITYQRPVFFVRGQPIETVEVGAPLTLIIGDTGIASPTALTVGDVRAAWARDPEPFEKV
ncbi:MAG TPA: mevalonate kinase, partial [Anaerolineaceae bacterium]